MDNSAPTSEINSIARRDLDLLNKKLEGVEMPPELKEKALDMVARLERMFTQGFYSEEFEKVSHYIDWIIKVPWVKRVDRPIDLVAIKETMDKSHYGMESVKERIIEYMSVLKLRASRNLGAARAPIYRSRTRLRRSGSL
ncbi:MAG: Lon protease [Candidatus Collierbacteria bacterium GW2011_GWA2_44_13]|nr:MAG: Lon protease [Candidatus Collierbacteria bacterium GW2011_GWA2_44_13]